MANFSEHFKMNEQDAVLYIREKLPDFFVASEQLSCDEIGDGNINYVFRIQGEKSEKSIIIKHADKFIRSSNSATDTDRSRIEADMLLQERNFAPDFVPLVFLYDAVMCCIVMQDISDHQNMRYALMNYEIFSTFAEDISSFMAETLMRTTDLVLQPQDKKAFVKNYINPSMCNISERLVYTYPYKNTDGSNIVFEANKSFVEKEIYNDNKLHLEVAKLKNEFETNAQALIHGDLHSGSLFVKEGSTQVLDPEFGFYGPIGYDVGNLLAHLVFAWVRAYVLLASGAKKDKFVGWVENCLTTIPDLFRQKSKKILQNDCIDPMYATEDFISWYLQNIAQSTAGAVGTELIRRIVGSAKVKDITSIEDTNKRIQAEQLCIYIGKECILNKDVHFKNGSDYVKALHNATRKVG